jgi:hypothetical protein
MTRLTPMEVRRAERDEPPCPRCGVDIDRGQHVALVRDEHLGHAWVHLRHLAEPDSEAQH